MTKNQQIIFIIFLLGVANFLIWSYLLGRNQFSVLNFLDVGQGDASLLSFKNSGRILIDAGPGTKIMAELGGKLGFFDKRIDVIIISHPDSDHFAGFLEVLKSYTVQVLAYSGDASQSESFQALLNLAKEKKIRVIRLLAGDKIKIGVDYLKIFSPTANEMATLRESNEKSLIILGQINNQKILWTGDAESSKLLSIAPSIGLVDILKVSHHGSKTAGDQKFLEIIKPKMALIGVGANNRFGHPSDEVLERLNYLKAKILRTDLNGSIEIILDEK